jgi:hypothetical protein
MPTHGSVLRLGEAHPFNFQGVCFMPFSLTFKPRFLSLAAALAATISSGLSQADSISFVEQANGPVVVTHDNNDWRSFSYSSTNETATADATLLKLSGQGSLGDGTQAIFLKDGNGTITDILTASVQVIDASSYSVHYEFYSDDALPTVTPHSTGQYADVVINGITGYVGLQSFSHAIGVTSISAVPEPQAYLMAVMGLGVVGAALRRRAA